MNSPALSVVVAVSDSTEAVARCVASIGSVEGIEILVVAPAEIRPGQGGWPHVRWLSAGSGADVPALRGLGLEQARGPVVAFTEDSCRLAPGWADGWITAFEDPETLAATGPVEHGEGGSAIDWAVFFCEYAPFLEPMGQPIATRLAGNNFAVRRRWLARNLSVGEGIHESRLAARLREEGGRLREVGRSRAWHVRRFDLREATRDRLRFGFQFGRLRAVASPIPVRLLAMAAGPGILLAQLGRLGWILAVKRRHRERFLTCLPGVASLLAAWSLGEWLGWVVGPGSASRKPVGVIESPQGGGPRGRRPSSTEARRSQHAYLPLRR